MLLDTILVTVGTLLVVFVSGQQDERVEDDQSIVTPQLVEEDGRTFPLEVGRYIIINCTAVGRPPPAGLFWERSDGKNLKSLGIVTEGFRNETTVRRSMIINSTQERMQGQYICLSSTFAIVSDSSSFSPQRRRLDMRIRIEVGPPPSPTIPAVNDVAKSRGELSTGATVATVVTVVLVTLLGVCACTELHRRKNRNGLSKRDVELFLKGNPDGVVKTGFAHENVSFQPYDSSYELEEDNLKIDKDNILGAGSFGVVYRGRYKADAVAIKTIKPGSDKTYLRALLIELKVMIHIGRHPFINQLVGATSKDLRRGLLNVVVELCSSNLESYLRQNRYTFINQFDVKGILDPRTGEEHSNECLRTLDLMRMAYQIADGMEYLGSRNVIHGDLAARNILLSEDGTAKITDFGLARQMYDYANYVKRNQEPLPWRWMSIEGLKYLSFSPMSDVWSYGVLLWELFTCGDVPYPGESWTTQFVEKLIQGLRLTRPKYSNKQLYSQIMVNCWNPTPKNRITFSQLKSYFGEYTKYQEQQSGQSSSSARRFLGVVHSETPF
ncbi:vascular endothelial growth factor receptor 2 [Folsomia candida]|uniref:Vascular endothelial growth factor receptor 2 n=1 Tax=Folsomia candida TaxID=158441 RepID=A0A226EUG0_FOLCA|nr:vascular endothelial growth factor receptor 2 [Folsomia candida]OXA61232.1 Vascular endothelial growth factor receptor 2 [Folsomia candida]